VQGTSAGLEYSE
jgi:hypothetical protein